MGILFLFLILNFIILIKHSCAEKHVISFTIKRLYNQIIALSLAVAQMPDDISA